MSLVSLYQSLWRGVWDKTLAFIKATLKAMFESCETYVQVFQMISTARAQGYSIEEVNSAASWRKNRIAKEEQQRYKKIPTSEIVVDYRTKYKTLPIEVNNLNNPRIVFSRTQLTI